MIYTPTVHMRMPRVWGPDDLPMWARELQSPSPGPGATGSAASNYLENKVLDHVLGKTTFTAVDPLYYALYTASPGDTDAGTEVSTSGTSYARQFTPNNGTGFPAASGGTKSNGELVNFGTATGAGWGTVQYIGLKDASSGGNLYFWGSIDPSIPIGAGDSLSFPIGTIAFGMD